MGSKLNIGGTRTYFYDYIRLSRTTTILKSTEIDEVGLMTLHEANNTYDDTVAISLADGKGNFDWRYLVHTINQGENVTIERDTSSGIVTINATGGGGDSNVHLYSALISSSDLSSAGKCWFSLEVYPTYYWTVDVYRASDGRTVYPDIILDTVNGDKKAICLDFASAANFNDMSGNGDLYCKILIAKTGIAAVLPRSTKPASGEITPVS